MTKTAAGIIAAANGYTVTYGKNWVVALNLHMVFVFVILFRIFRT